MHNAMVSCILWSPNLDLPQIPNCQINSSPEHVEILSKWWCGFLMQCLLVHCVVECRIGPWFVRAPDSLHFQAVVWGAPLPAQLSLHSQRPQSRQHSPLSRRFCQIRYLITSFGSYYFTPLLPPSHSLADFGVSAKDNAKGKQKHDTFIGTPYW